MSIRASGSTLFSRGAEKSRRDFCRVLAMAVGGAGVLGAAAAFGKGHAGHAPAVKGWNQLPVSPLVHADGSVTFLFPAGQEKQVILEMGGIAPLPLVKRADGLWQATAGPLPPGIYSYAFNVDGVRVLDPLNPWVKKNLFYSGSLVLVPGKPASLWQDLPVPHGAVAEHFYHSKVVGDNRNYYVYTPPGYDPRAAKTYPVLYLLHGYSDVAGAWTKMGRANFILDNLIHQRKATPMIVVMPLGYGDDSIVSRTTANVGDPKLLIRNIERFKTTLFSEIMPRIKREYSIAVGPGNTAIAGLSMGGGEALDVGLNNLDKFAWIGGMSSYCGTAGPDFTSFFPKLSPHDNARLRLLWVSCGRQDTLVGTANRNLDAWLTKRGIKFHQVWTPGGHQWRVWRDNLANLVPMLFKP